MRLRFILKKKLSCFRLKQRSGVETEEDYGWAYANFGEVDVCMAFTKALTEINSIPVFCQFDVWKPRDLKCDVHKMSNVTSYIAKPCQ